MRSIGTETQIQPANGETAIGAGLIAGAAQLDSYTPPAGVTDPNLAILCLTDGNENVEPDVLSTPVTAALSAYAADVYAIGLGTEDGVSATTLGAISKYMLVTGDRAADQRRFMVTKYFVQILADIKKADILVDPDGILYAGSVHEVKFDVSEAEVELELILLSPAARYLGIELVTPGGDVLSPSSLGPNASLRVNPLDAVLRVGLPALPSRPATSHAGRWTLRLCLDKQRQGALREQLLAVAAVGKAPRAEYSVIVQARSNLSLEVGRAFPHLTPGDMVSLSASLAQYRVPLAAAKVTALVTGPNGYKRQERLSLDGGSQQYLAAFPAPSRGVYTCRIVAEGLTLGGRRFTRETTRTFAVGDPNRRAPGGGSEGGRPDPMCTLVACLLRDPGVRRWMDAHGVDAERLKRCLAEVCGARPGTCEPAPHPSQTGRSVVGLTADDVAKLVHVALKQQVAGDPLAVPAPEALALPQLDPALFEVPMFMPALAWTEDGEIVVADTGKALPPRGEPSTPVECVEGLSAADAERLAEAGIRTAGELLARPQELNRILGLRMAQIRPILEAARTAGAREPARGGPHGGGGAEGRPAKPGKGARPPKKKGRPRKDADSGK